VEDVGAPLSLSRSLPLPLPLPLSIACTRTRRYPCFHKGLKVVGRPQAKPLAISFYPKASTFLLSSSDAGQVSAFKAKSLGSTIPGLSDLFSYKRATEASGSGGSSAPGVTPTTLLKLAVMSALSPMQNAEDDEEGQDRTLTARDVAVAMHKMMLDGMPASLCDIIPAADIHDVPQLFSAVLVPSATGKTPFDAGLKVG